MQKLGETITSAMLLLKPYAALERPLTDEEQCVTEGWELAIEEARDLLLIGKAVRDRESARA